MNPNKALWEKGDFTRIADTIRASESGLVKLFGIKPGMEVLDLACGDGNTAIPAARLGAKVTGVDIATNLVEAGNRRIAEEGLDNIRIMEGDATDLKELADEQFDLLVTVFGAMFAPRPMEVAREMVRVVRPGGRIVMANWIPGDPTLVAQILRISAAYTPPPPEGFVSPMLWGVPERVTERFVTAGLPADRVSFENKQITFEAAYAASELLKMFKEFYGPTMNAFDAAEASGRSAELQGELDALFNEQNSATKPGEVLIVVNFLLVTVQR